MQATLRLLLGILKDAHSFPADFKEEALAPAGSGSHLKTKKDASLRMELTSWCAKWKTTKNWVLGDLLDAALSGISLL